MRSLLITEREEDEQDNPPTNTNDLVPIPLEKRTMKLRCSGRSVWMRVLWWSAVSWMLLVNALLLTSVILFASYTHGTLPQTTGTLRVKGLTDSVTVEREANGMIHITANSVMDAAFAQGLVMAQERLWQIEFQRRIATGTLSQVVGEDGLETDKMFRTLGIFHVSKQDAAYYEANPTEAFNTIKAFCNGINSYLDTDPPLPLEFKVLGYKPHKFEPAEVMVWFKVMSLDLSTNMNQELERLRLTFTRKLTQQRVDTLWPPYPTTGPTVVQFSDLSNHTRALLNVSRTTPVRKTRSNMSVTKQSESQQQSASTANGPSRSKRLLDRFLRVRHHPRASNNWVLHGNRTTTGKPLLCNDPHLDFSAPSVWILMHLKVRDGPEEVIGAALAGSPGIIIGRNNRVAWGVTNVGTDVMDTYVLDEEKRNGVHGYWRNGTWEPMQSRTELIKVKDGDDVILNVNMTTYGPVISDFFLADLNPRPTVALRWVSLEPRDISMETYSRLNRVQNFDEFRTALSYYQAPAQNFIYADVDGNIGYQCPGKTPIRTPENNNDNKPTQGPGRMPSHSNSSEGEWNGYVPFEELPYVYNPARGYVSSANNKVIENTYKYTILGDSDWEAPYRGQRIVDLIEAKKKHSMEDMKQLQGDVVTLAYSALRPVLAGIVVPAGSKQRSGIIKWRDRLLKWNGDTAIDSQEATVFKTWSLELSRLPVKEVGQTFWDNLLYVVNSLTPSTPHGSNNTTPSTTDDECVRAGFKDCPTFAGLAFERAMQSFEKDGDVSIPTWGELHKVKMPHLLFGQTPLGCVFERSAAHGGDDFTVNIGGWSFFQDKDSGWDMTAGATYRQIVNLENMEESVFVQPMGQSGNVFSEHYDDYFDKWRQMQYIPMRMRGYTPHATLHLQP
eukprot:TRINITY_DN6768_c0_g1_i2.p1 TRINITY_DN6768_c0_g1~~TRINITY_DN6768_c0_g1_i2.p1  ORF type:complete len:1035 (+),score=159.34 TRINITY_DN6768_c0_g1_i2:419-3106(+)